MAGFRHTRLVSAGLTISALWLGAAQAATYDLVLQGNASDTDVISFESGTTQFTIGRVALSGFDAPIEVLQGDSFSATVDFVDGPMVVPSSPNQVFGFEVRGADDPVFDDAPGAEVVLSGSITFYLGGDVVLTGGGGCGNCSFVAIFRAPGESFTFDRMEVTGEFRNLSSPYTIDNASFNYQLSQPVPEPAAWALWLAGLGMAGVSARRRATRAARQG